MLKLDKCLKIRCYMFHSMSEHVIFYEISERRLYRRCDVKKLMDTQN